MSPLDRRSLVKERHRRAIIDAAAELMDETGGTSFTVDELAERADVSRRTVFNHFASVDDIVITVCGEILGGIVDRVELREAQTGSLFDEVADAVRGVELVDSMAYLSVVVGGQDPAWSPRLALILTRAFTEVSEAMTDKITQRHPNVDLLTVHLLVGSLMSGLIIIHRHWFAATGAAVDGNSRRIWSELLERLLDSNRKGFESVGRES